MTAPRRGSALQRCRAAPDHRESSEAGSNHIGNDLSASGAGLSKAVCRVWGAQTAIWPQTGWRGAVQASTIGVARLNRAPRSQSMKVPLKLNSIDQEHLQELYNAAGVARDELPYTEE